MVESRRARLSTSPELQLVVRIVAVFTREDLEVARALDRADFNLKRAAATLGEDMRPDCFRQRFATLVRHIREAMPQFPIRRGAQAHEVSADQYDLGTVAGISDHRRE